MDLDAIKGQISERANEVLGQAVDFAREKPHVAVGIAFGVGWVLGNGLPPRVIMGVARLGWKAALGGALAGSGIMGIFGEAANNATGNGSRRTSPEATSPLANGSVIKG